MIPGDASCPAAIWYVWEYLYLLAESIEAFAVNDYIRGVRLCKMAADATKIAKGCA